MNLSFKHGNKCIIHMILCIIIIIGFSFYGILNVTYALTTGQVYGTAVTPPPGLNIRERANGSSNVLATAAEGDTVEILGETKENNSEWYNVKYNGHTGYAAKKYIRITSGALPVKKGVLNDGGVRFRTVPDSSSNATTIREFSKGTEIKVLGKTYSPSNEIWYYADYSGQKGFVHSDYVTIKSDGNDNNIPVPTPKPELPDENVGSYEQELLAFPESYQKYIREFHTKHPNWIFIADDTGLNWNDVFNKEFGTLGFKPSLVDGNYRKDPWKSMEKGDYDFNTGLYTKYDGRFVAASRSAVAFYLDPRSAMNFDDNGFFQFSSSRFYEGIHTSTGLQRILDNPNDSSKPTFMQGIIPGEDKTYNEVIMQASRESGINPYVLAAKILQEQGNSGEGGCIQGPYYNFFNVGAYPHDGRDSIENGDLYAEKMNWNKRSISIIEGAKWFANEYTNVRKQHTPYYNKFNVLNGIDNVATHQYMTNIEGADGEGFLIANGYADNMNAPLVFYIPVYHNMPENHASIPPNEGNNNNFLDAITVDGYSLSPVFDRYTMEYRVNAGNATSINLSAVANNPSSKIDGLGVKSLVKGENRFTITVTATSGEMRTYEVIVSTTGDTHIDHWTDDGKKYIYADGTHASGYTEIDGRYYYFDETTGYMKTGIFEANGQLYGFWGGPGYGYSKGWDHHRNGTTYSYGGGKLATGYTQIDGRYYYFDETTGYMKTGIFEINGQLYGFWGDGYGYSKGWDKHREGTTYSYGGGKLATGYTQIDGMYYYFNKNGFLNEAKWEESNLGKKYKYANKTYATGYTQIDGRYYYFDETTGYMKTGIFEVNGQLYGFWGDGYGYSKGWDHHRNGTTYSYGGGKLATGYTQIDGKYYYFDETTGYMKTGIFDVNGQLYGFWGDGYGYSKGWDHHRNGTTYSYGGGKLATGYTEIDGRYYYFDETTGYMKTGIFEADGQLYGFWGDGYGYSKGWDKHREGTTYSYGGGKLATGYTEIDGRYYYFDKTTGYMKTGIFEADGQLYGFWGEGYGYSKGWDKHREGTTYSYGGGRLVRGCIRIENKTYSFNQNGFLVDDIPKWHLDSETKKLIYSDGTFATGLTFMDNNLYFFNEDGNMVKGKMNLGGNLYYFDEDEGSGCKKGFIKTNNGILYSEGNGLLRTEYFVLDGKPYYFDKKTGYLKTGIFFDNKNAYAFKNDGSSYDKGWHIHSNGKKIYSFGNGIIATGLNNINGEICLFSKEGFLIVIKGKGIDVSEFQGKINWQSVANQGIEFVFIRVGGRFAESGKIFLDSMFNENIKNASRYGIKIGAYFYTQAINEKEAIEEAEYICEQLKYYNIELPVTIDTESFSLSNGFIGRHNKITVQQRTNVIKAFCDKVKTYGYIPMVYSNLRWLENNLYMNQLNEYKVWVAQYNDSCNYNGDFDYWQYSSSGHIPGINGRVDLNVFVK